MAETQAFYPFGEHRHGGESRHAYSHAHAYPDYEHGHFLRAVCGSPACEGAATHDIHEMPEEAPSAFRKVRFGGES